MKAKVLFSMFVLLAVNSVAGAQTTPAKPNPVSQPAAGAPSGTILPPDSMVTGPYLLGPGDVISVASIGFPQFNSQIAIPPDGFITPILIKKHINVVGMTTDQLAAQLVQEYSKYVVSPDFTVSLVQKRPIQPISVFGAISGNLNWQPGLHLIDALARLGGSQTGANLSRVVLTHPNGESVTLDVSHPETKANSPENVLLGEGDTIYIPLKHEMISVTGEVGAPGAYAYTHKMTVMEAISDAAGLRMENADLANAVLTRDGKQTPLDLYALYKENKIQNNMPLEPGDSIFVPKVRNRVYFLGAVSKIGWYNLRPGDKLMDALTQMGPEKDADLAHIRVIEISGDKKAYKPLIVNFQKIENGDVSGNIPLHAGEVIFVPKRGHKFGLSDVLGALYPLNLLDGAARLFSGNF